MRPSEGAEVNDLGRLDHPPLAPRRDPVETLLRTLQACGVEEAQQVERLIDERKRELALLEQLATVLRSNCSDDDPPRKPRGRRPKAEYGAKGGAA